MSQRALVADRVATLKDGENKGAQCCAASQADAARALGVSRRQVQKARVVRVEAEPEDVAAVERGEATINAVVKKVRPPLRGPRVHTEQAEVVCLRRALRGSTPPPAATPSRLRSCT